MEQSRASGNARRQNHESTAVVHELRLQAQPFDFTECELIVSGVCRQQHTPDSDGYARFLESSRKFGGHRLDQARFHG